MKKRVWTIMLVLLALSLAVSGLFSCGRDDGGSDTPPDLPPQSEKISGNWYYSADDGEYLLFLNEDLSATLLTGGELKNGIYFLQKGNLSLKFGEEAITATVGNDAITLNYGGAQYRYLPRTTYTVTYDSKGGSDVPADKVLNSQTVNKPADPTRGDYVFLGWYSDAATTKPWAFGADPVTADITLYAKWAAKVPGQAEYTVSFDLGYDAQTPAITTIGGKAYGVSAPTREGYIFRGWWISDTASADALTYLWEEDVVFQENTTLYALWEDADLGAKLPAPCVSVEGNDIFWDSISGASAYRLEIRDPSGKVLQSSSDGSTSASFDFSAQPEGEYTVSVTALASAAANNSDAAVRVVRNKGLSRVSLFSVAEPSILLWNGVANAEKYYITVRCGNSSHVHTLLDNGNSTYYNFGNCEMREGGIEFTVTAVADGYASSTSVTYKYERKLASAGGLAVNAETETLYWNAVENATDYILVISDGENETTVRVSGATSYCLKNYAPGKDGLTVSVTPYNRGYNSPAPTAYHYNKTILAAPGGLTIKDGALTWDAVAGANAYDVRVNSRIVSTDGNSYDLTAEAAAAEGTVWKFSVRAKGSTVSLWSDEFVCVTGVMKAAPRYEAGSLYWTPVLGAAYYEIRVNDSDPARAAGSSSAPITLTAAGNNTVSVRFYNGEKYSEWKSITVYAYTVSFDTRGGIAVPPVYLAQGDPIAFPDAEKTGYDFADWYRAPGGAAGNAARYDDLTYAASGDIMLFANWSSKAYELTYDFCGGSGSADTVSVAFGKPFQLAIPTNDNHAVVFSGWYSEPNGSGFQYTDERGNGLGNWSVPNDATIYACWLDVLSFNYLEYDDAYSVKQGPGINLVTRIEIPETYNGKPVIMVEGNAFKNCTKLESITIPNTVRIVETNNAFYNCKVLTEVNVTEIPTAVDPVYSSDNGVLLYQNERTGELELAYYPVARNAAYDIPDGVTIIPQKTFSGSQITEVTIPASLKSIETSAFSGCRQLTSVTFRPMTGEGEETPLEFGANAFTSCTALTSFVIPARTAKFSTDIFNYCSNLERVDVDPGSTKYASTDGVLCSLDESGLKDTILFCPAGRAGAYTIPAGITKIGKAAFNRCTKLTELTIPVYVTEIGDDAFRYCSGLTKVTFEGTEEIPRVDPLTIGKYSFASCTGIIELDFQDKSNVTLISASAFSGARRLEKVCIPASVTKIDNYAFSSCTGLTELSFAPATSDGEQLTFGNSVFSGCTGLVTVNIPAHLESIGSNVFNGCTNLQNVFVDENNPALADIDGVLFDKEITTLKFYPIGRAGAYEIPDTVTTVEKDVFRSNTVLTAVTIPASVTEIGNYAFYGCTALEEVTFAAKPAVTPDTPAPAADADPTEEETPDTVTLGTYLFSGCVSLHTVTLSDRVTEINDRCFEKCSALKEITFPDTLTSIGSSAFSNAGLTSVTLPKGLQSIGSYSFEYTYITSVTLPASLNATMTHGTLENFQSCPGLMAFYNCYSLRTVVFESGVTCIPVGMFQGCTGLEEVFIPKTMTAIGVSAFKGCTSLSKVTFEEGGTEDLEIGLAGTYVTSKVFDVAKMLKAYDSGAFQGCTSLTTLALPARTTALVNSTFKGCTSLASISLAEQGQTSRLKYIGHSVFYDCGKLTRIALSPVTEETPEHVIVPGTVEGMGEQVFYKCVTMPVVIFENGTVEFEIPKNTFTSCTKLTDLYLGNRVTKMTAAMTGTTNSTMCSSLQHIYLDESNEHMVLQDGVLYDKDKTEVYYCPLANAVTELVLPDTLQIISDKAFQYCATLQKVTIPASVVYIGASAFNHCDALTTVIFLPTAPDAGEETPATETDPTAPAASSLLVLGDSCFAYTALETIVIPDSVVAIGKNTFSNCSFLTSVTLPAALGKASSNHTVEALEDLGITTKFYDFNLNCFTKCYALQEVKIGSDALNYKTQDGVLLTKDGKTLLFYPMGKTDLEYTIPAGVTTVGMASGHAAAVSSSAAPFYQNQLLQKVIIPTGVTKICKYSFSNAVALQTIVFEDKRTTDLTLDGTGSSDSPFLNCDALTKVTIPAKVKLRPYLFGGSSSSYTCDSLEEVYFTADCTLTEIPNYCFRGCKLLNKVVLGPKMTKIGTYAFYDCTALSDLSFLSQIVNIGNSAFWNCGVTNLTIPKTLTTIGTNAFYGCKALTTVVFEDGNNGTNVKTLPQYMFQNCSALTSITLSSTTTGFAGSVFNGTNFKTFTVPDGVKELPNNFMQNNKELTTVILPSSLTKIGNNAFSGCSSLTTIVIPDSVTSIGNSAFANCTSLTELVLPEKLTSLGTTVFSGCSALETISIPAGVTKIDTNAFQNCRALVSVAFADGSVVASIGATAFKGCTALTSINLPATVTTIGKQAFMDCAALAELTLPAELTEIGDGTFQNCAALAEIELPAKMTEIGKNAFNGCAGLTRLEMLPGITSIGDGAFSGCVLLESVYIPGTVTTIGANPFEGCMKLSQIELAPDNTSFVIIDNALYSGDVTKLISYPTSAYGAVTVPDTVTSIAAGAFRGSKITGITLPEGLTTIAANTFEGCKNLAGIHIPVTVTSIGASAFADSGVTYVTMGDAVKTIGDRAFYRTPLQSVTIGSSVTKVGQYAFAECAELSSLVFEQTGNSVLQLGNYAFFGCTALEEITLPKRLRTTVSGTSYVYAVGLSCFEGCTGLSAVHFGDEGAVGMSSYSLAAFGSRAFAGCTSLTAFDCPDYVGSTSYSVPGSSSSEYVSVFGNSCFEGCTALARVTFRPIGTVKYAFGAYAFRGCTALTSIDLPENTVEIGDGAFAGSGLTEIVIPRNATCGTGGTVGMFEDCKSLTSAVLSNVYSVSSRMFAGCTALESVTLPLSVSTISSSAFEGCTSLTTLDLSNVTFIQRNAFKDCTGIKELHLSARLATVYDGAFAGWTAEQTIYIAYADAEHLPTGWYEGWNGDCEAQIVWGA